MKRLFTLFIILSISASALAGINQVQQFQMNPVPNKDYSILLKTRTITTDSNSLDNSLQNLVQMANLRNDLPDGNFHFLVQLWRTPDAAAKEQYASRGLSLLAYIPNFAWVASVPADKILSLANIPGVRWAGPLQSKDKIDSIVTKMAESVMAEDLIPIICQPFADIAADNAMDLVEALDGQVVDMIQTTNSLVVHVPQKQLQNLAASESIMYIASVLPPLEPCNDGVRSNIGSNALQSAPYNLTGSGIDVLIYDAGTADSGHDDFAGRITIGDSTSVNEHSTHVAGTCGGSGLLSASHGGTALQWRGVATGVDLISYGFQYDYTGTFLYTNPGDIEADWSQAKNTHGADLGSASLGTNTASNGFPCDYEGNYGATAQLLDGMVGGSLGEPYIITWANGNERGGTARCGSTYTTTAPPSCAKNPIQVGATNSDNDTMTSFSSWGPTDDGRLKPVICGPGCEAGGEGYIHSTLPGDTYGGTGWCGTSMATPAIAGLVALMLQQYRATFVTTSEFLPSTAKAILIQTAVDLGNTGPDFQYGYGRVDAVAAVDAVKNQNFYEGSLATTGAAWSATMQVPSGMSQLKVSLAWDDAPGALLAAKELVNDLNLYLVSPTGTISRPYILNPASPSSAATRGIDSLNNMEQVVVNSPDSGTWQIYVTGSDIPTGPQSFSLVFPDNMSLATQTPGPTVTSAPPTSTPSATPPTGTSTPIPPTNTPVPPTNTPIPTSTAVPGCPDSVAVWVQPPDCVSGSTYASQYDSVYPFSAESIDDFLFENYPGPISCIQWWAGYWNSGYAEPDSWNIIIYEFDSGCTPGSVVYSETIPFAECNESAGCNGSYSYFANLSAPFIPDTGVRYGLVVQGNLLYEPQVGIRSSEITPFGCSGMTIFPAAGLDDWTVHDTEADHAFVLFADRGVLNGSVDLERPGMTPPGANYSIPLTLSICSATSGGNYATSTDNSGNFSLELPAGVFDILIKNSHTLAIQALDVEILPGGSTGLINFTTLAEGDANDDNTVTSLDFFILRDTYNKALGEDGYDARADFDENDMVTSNDFFLLRGHYNESGAECPVRSRGTLSENPEIITQKKIAAETSGQINLEMVPKTRITGEQEFEFWIRSDNSSFNAVDLHLNFDPAAIDVSDIHDLLPSHWINMQTSIDNIKGYLDFAGVTFTESATDMLLCSVKIQSKQLTEGPIFTVSQGSSVRDTRVERNGSKLNFSFSGLGL